MNIAQSLIRPLVFLLAVVPALCAQATTVQRFTFEQLAEYAEFIFQGRVLDVRSDEAADGLIYTWVRFEVDEVIKGASPGWQLELRFLGGEAAGRSLSVAEMHVPAQGEAGIYFIDRLHTDLVNPLLGWSQGHFLISEGGDGEPVVTDAEGRAPVVFSAPAPAAAGGPQGRSALQSKAPLTSPEDFKDAIRQVLEGAAP